MTHDEAINKLVNNMVNYKPWEVEALYIAIKALEQAMWIPVSEKLPEEPKRYLVYTRYDEVMTDYFYSDDYNSEFLQGEDIIAWMPLPEPYRESEE